MVTVTVIGQGRPDEPRLVPALADGMPLPTCAMPPPPFARRLTPLLHTRCTKLAPRGEPEGQRVAQLQARLPGGSCLRACLIETV